MFTVAPDHPLAAAAEPVAESERLARCAIVVADSSRHLPPRSAGLLNGQATLTVHNRAAQLEAQRMGLGVGPLPRPVAERKTAAERVLIKRTGDGRATFVFDAA